MAYCGPRGIPLSTFLGWPEEDQQAALMWQQHEGRRCQDCSTHREDWIDENGRIRTVPPQHWHEEICPGCQAKQRAAKAAAQDADGTRGLVLVAANGPSTTCPTCNT